MFVFNLFVFSSIFHLVLGGNVVHLLIKLSLAMRIPNFSFKVFLERNIVGWCAGLILSSLYAYAVSTGDSQPPMTDFIGYGLAGSSLGKNLLKHVGNGKI